MKIQVRKPFFPPKSIDNIQKNIRKILESGQLTLGENVNSFESKFSKFHKIKYACGVSSATAGLHLSLLALDIKKGDQVIIPAKTFISTANAALYCNATPIFCDVDDTTFQMDPLKLKKLINKNTKAIIPVHLGGNVCPMDEILEISNKENISIVEDAAHAHGATYNKQYAGTFGRIGVFSFYPDKVMASTDGGMIVTNDSKIQEKLELLRNVGRKKLGKHDFSVIGYNYRMNEIQAILGNEQLQLLPYMLKKRRAIAEKYDLELNELKSLNIQMIKPNVNSAYYSYIVRLVKGNLKNLRIRLAEQNIETSSIFTSIYKTKPYEKIFGKRNGLCPITEILDSQTFTIPLHPGLQQKDMLYIIKNLKKFVK
jgi:perosamine synthetase